MAYGYGTHVPADEKEEKKAEEYNPSISDLIDLIDNEMSEISDLYEEKARAYSKDSNALENFDIQSQLTGMTPFQIWSVFAAKHDIAIMKAIAENPELPEEYSEGMESRIRDRVVYSMLLLALLKRAKGAQA